MSTVAGVGMSDYVRGLREKVGNDLLLMPSVHVVLRDDEGRILLVRHVEGRWQLPGGAVDPGETPAETARRECREELGATVEPERLLGVYGGPEHRIRYANGDDAAWVASIFAARLVAGEPAAPGDDEVDAVGWFGPDELDALPVSPATRSILRDVLAGVSFR
jgi:8-oxo-dGTP pyrophosphatase MutT (NUDIX family)